MAFSPHDLEPAAEALPLLLVAAPHLPLLSTPPTAVPLTPACSPCGPGTLTSSRGLVTGSLPVPRAPQRLSGPWCRPRPCRRLPPAAEQRPLVHVFAQRCPPRLFPSLSLPPPERRLQAARPRCPTRASPQHTRGLVHGGCSVTRPGRLCRAMALGGPLCPGRPSAHGGGGWLAHREASLHREGPSF